MASIGHVIVGLAAARWESERVDVVRSGVAAGALYAGLSLLPDADVLGFRCSIAYGDEWGHRGATHSFVFALGVALLFTVLAHAAGFTRRFGLTLSVAFAVLASHGVLDALTDGGMGAALFWPFSNRRWFAPFTPIPVAPIGRGLLSLAALRVFAVELVLFAPLAIYALWPRRRPSHAP